MWGEILAASIASLWPMIAAVMLSVMRLHLLWTGSTFWSSLAAAGKHATPGLLSL